MNYKTILRVSDVLTAIEDWKRGLISDRELLDKVRDIYVVLEKEIGPEVVKTDQENGKNFSGNH